MEEDSDRMMEEGWRGVRKFEGWRRSERLRDRGGKERMM